MTDQTIKRVIFVLGVVLPVLIGIVMVTKEMIAAGPPA